MLDQNLILDFQQAYKQIQINAGLGITEDNIFKVRNLLERACHILNQAVDKAYPLASDDAEKTVKVNKIK